MSQQAAFAVPRFGVSVAPRGAPDGRAASIAITGWVAHETSEVVGVTLLSRPGDVVRHAAVEASRADAGSPRAAATAGGNGAGPARREFRMELSLLELAPGELLRLAAELRTPTGETTRVELGPVGPFPAVVPASRYAERVSPLSVTGLGRSGTTLLMALLSRLPSVVVPGPHPFEFREVTYLAHAARVLVSPADFGFSMGRDAFEAKHPSMVGFDPYDTSSYLGRVGVPAVRRWFEYDRPWRQVDHMKQLVDEFASLQPSADDVPPRYIAEKMHPGALMHLIANAYPGSRRIFLMRDFRDVFCSARSFNEKRGTQQFNEAAFPDSAAWLRHIGTGSRRVLRHYEMYRDSALLVRYEDLVRTPDETLGRICAYAGIDASPHVIARAVEEGSRLGRPEQHGTSDDAASSIGRWRGELTTAERDVAAAFGDVLDAVDYPTDDDAPAGASVPVRVTAAERRARRSGEGVPPTAQPDASRSPFGRSAVAAGLRQPLKGVRRLGQWTKGIVLEVDAPSSGDVITIGRVLTVSGWAFSRQRPIARVDIALDGRPLGSCRPEHERADVAARWPNVPSARLSGFHEAFSVEGFTPGTSEVTISAVDDAGKHQTMRRRVTLVVPAPYRPVRSAADVAPAPRTDRAAVLFMHIPKTAGTSLRSVLHEIVPPHERVYLYPRSPNLGVPAERFPELPQEVRDQLRLVFGHFRFGIHEALSQPAMYVTMIREPIDRLISLYYHHRGSPTAAHHRAIVDGDLSLEDYLLSGMFTTDNQMVRQITGTRGVPFGQSDDAMLELALGRIRTHFSAVLVMERMDASMRRLGELLGTPIPEIPRKNPTRARPKRDAVDPALRDRLAHVNRLDMALYEHAKAVFDADDPDAARSRAELDEPVGAGSGLRS